MEHKLSNGAKEFARLAEATPGMVESLKAGNADALVEFLELAPGVKVESITVEKNI